HTPAGIEGHPRGRCESCGRHLWSEGGYRVPGLKGLFCSLVCIECSIAEKMGQETDCPGADRQRGAAAFLSENSGPGIYSRLAQGGEATDSKRCLECGTSLKEKRADSVFCSATHKMRFRRQQKSKTAQNWQISRNTPIQNTRLIEAQNAG